MEWNFSVFLISTFFVMLGALLQAATGVGAGLVIVPLLALISYELVPGPMIFASLALSTMMAFRGRNHIDYRYMKTLLAGLLLGTVIASYYISQLPLEKLGLVFGILIITAVIFSVSSPRFHLSTKSVFSAGTLSGFMGTSAGVGAPILALLYQHQSGPIIRASLAFVYFVSSIVTLGFLNLAGRFGEAEIISGILLIPGFILGYLLSPRLVEHIDKGYARQAVLLLSTTAACILIGRIVFSFR